MMITSELFRRQAQEADKGFLLEWRNDEDTRLNSINKGVVSQEDHDRWFSLHKGELTIYEFDNIPCGVTRLTDGELSWTVAPSFRGKGLGKAIVRIATKDRGVFSRILSSNYASRKIAESAGFVLVKPGLLETWEKKNDCTIG